MRAVSLILAVVSLSAATPQIIDGYRVSGTEGVSPEAISSFRQQIAGIDKLPIAECTKAFFHDQPVKFVTTLGQRGTAGAKGIALNVAEFDAGRPVLLHELLHRFHRERLPDGFANQQVIDAYQAARESGVFPAKAYMLKDKREFFAMTASALLSGHVARPPFTRERVEQTMPEYARWLRQLFGRPGDSCPPAV